MAVIGPKYYILNYFSTVLGPLNVNQSIKGNKNNMQNTDILVFSARATFGQVVLRMGTFSSQKPFIGLVSALGWLCSGVL